MINYEANRPFTGFYIDNKFKLLILIEPFNRNKIIKIAKPIAASEAATVKTIKAKISPIKSSI